MMTKSDLQALQELHDRQQQKRPKAKQKPAPIVDPGPEPFDENPLLQCLATDEGLFVLYGDNARRLDLP